jgi:hypothetical protein
MHHTTILVSDVELSEDRIKQRKNRIDLLQKMIKEASGKESTKKVLARFCVDTGVTEFTAQKYLQLLKDANLVTP